MSSRSTFQKNSLCPQENLLRNGLKIVKNTNVVFRIRPSAKIESFKRIRYAEKLKGCLGGKLKKN